MSKRMNRRLRVALNAIKPKRDKSVRRLAEALAHDRPQFLTLDALRRAKEQILSNGLVGRHDGFRVVMPWQWQAKVER